MVLASEPDLGIHSYYYGFRVKTNASLILLFVDNNMYLLLHVDLGIMHIVHFCMHELSFVIHCLLAHIHDRI